MKIKTILIIVLIVFAQLLKAQEKKGIYSIGVGVGNENNISNYGIYFTNDYKYFVLDWLAINPRISFFQSTSSFEPAVDFGYRSHSGIFFDLGLSIYPFKRFSLNVGPSYEVGDESYLSMKKWENDVVVQEWYENNSIREFGFYADIEYSWPMTKKLIGTFGIKTNYLYFYPGFVGIVCKVGF
jgi:hypothetical protein